MGDAAPRIESVPGENRIRFVSAAKKEFAVYDIVWRNGRWHRTPMGSPAAIARVFRSSNKTHWWKVRTFEAGEPRDHQPWTLQYQLELAEQTPPPPTLADLPASSWRPEPRPRRSER